MKKQLLTLFLLVIGTVLFASTPSKVINRSNLNGVFTIDQNDTVFFDLTQKVITGNYIEFPVFIKSDDVINAVDFAIKFDVSKLTYDSLKIHNTSMSPLANYNTNDSTLRLTSFDLQPIPNNTKLVTLRFKLLGGAQIRKTDFNSIAALLNGDACTGIVIEQSIPSGINNSDASKVISVYPNPATGMLSIGVTQNATIQLINTEGQIILETEVVANQKQIINTAFIPNGNYLIKAIGSNSMSTKKIVIVNSH